jgi:carboxymethylenebutenolidase
MAISTKTVLEHHGATVPTLVYKPEGDGPHPAIVLAAEAYGLNQFTRGVAERLSDAGYVVIVPDYYRGNGLTRPDDYTDFTEVMEFIGRLDFTGAANDVLAAIENARLLPEVDKDRIAVWGYCTGGTLAMLASGLDRNLSAAVWFFPSQPTFAELTPEHPVHPVDLIWSINCPVLVIYGDQDPIGPSAFIADLRDRFERWGIDHQINIYPGAGHAFSAPVAPLRNDAADAASWIDALQFLHERLSTV